MAEENLSQAMDQATVEYKSLFHKLRFIKKVSDRVSAVNMSFMRARDIERENSKPDNSFPTFTFTISTYNPELQKWDRCPGCGDDKIDKTAQNGNEWQGCYRCHVLLDKNGIIRSMNPNKKKEKKEDKTPETEFQTAKEISEEQDVH